MKEPHKKGLANHLDFESCADGGDAVGEALTEAHAGRVFSSVMSNSVVPSFVLF
jgi:hypothetical protein